MDSAKQKALLLSVYRSAVGALTLAALPFRSKDRLALYYGGARAGDAGGPLVQVKLVQRKFPQHFPGYSLVYMLSNAIYLPQFAVERLVGAGVPIVLNQNGLFYKAWYPDGWERENERMAGVHRVASHVFYQSEFCRMCAHRFLGPRSGGSEILYNGVDTDAFKPRERRETDQPFTFLVTGLIGKATAHRLKSSVQGLAAARKGGLNCLLKVAGGIDDDVRGEIASEVDRLGVADHVSFTGAYHHAQAPELYRSADAYLMTKQNDPCPYTVMEALATGLPVLYSASGGVPEQVGDDAGVGLPVEQTFDYPVVPTADEIAKGMEAIIQGSEQMSKAARARAVERFSLTHWYSRHEAVFNKLLGESLR
ncbi:MAG: glycosyltransferase family 4 protein [Pseudorhodoplanes sp.]